MKALVHIGIPKTGSTSIQEFLDANAGALRAQGFDYALCGPSRKVQAEYLVLTLHRMGRLLDDETLRVQFALFDMDRQAAFVAETERRIAQRMADSPCATWLISCEMLGWPQREEAFFRAFHDWASARFTGLRYVVYLRAQDDWLCSEYSQQLKNGGTESLSDLIRRIGPPDYDRFIAAWERIAGPDAVDVRLYEEAATGEGRLIGDFCRAAGIAAEGLVRPRSRNPKLTARQAGLLLRLNRAMADAARRSRGALFLRRAAKRVLLALVPGGAPLALDAATLHDLRNRVRQPNEALRQRRFPQRGALFPQLASAEVAR